MVVTIDIGNTNINFAWFAPTSLLLHYAAIRTDKFQTTDDLAVSYLNLLSLGGINADEIQGVIVSSVVPQLNYAVSHLFEKYFRISPLIVERGMVPIYVDYQNPDEIGADRLVNAYAALLEYPAQNLIVVDFGTATTLDIVSREKCYLGGVIIPGLLTSLHSMEEKASKLPHIDLNDTPLVIGKTTVDGIRSGMLHGSGAMLDGLCAKIEKEMKWDKSLVIGTGGLAALVSKFSDKMQKIEKHLTMKGLYAIWKEVHEAH